MMTERTARFIVPASLCATWPIAWFVRQRFASPGLEDYASTAVAERLWEPLAHGHVVGFLKAAATTGPDGPLFSMLSAPLSPFGPDAVVLAQFPLLVLLSLIVFETMRRYRGPRVAALTAALTVLSRPLFMWSLMGQMALMSCVCSVAVLSSYLFSNGFQKGKASLLTGATLGLLLLSRSIAIVYVAAATLTIVFASLIFHQRFDRLWLRNVLLAAASAILVAGVWVWKGGPIAWDYLTGIPYSANRPFTMPGNRISLRAHASLHDGGLVIVAVMAILAVAATWRAFDGARQRGDQSAEPKFVFGCFSILAFAGLSTSSIFGTAFELPIFAAGIPALMLLASDNDEVPWWMLTSLLVVIPMTLLQGWLIPGWEARSELAMPPLYAFDAYRAAGGPVANAQSINLGIATAIGNDDVLVVRDDAIVNVSSLQYLKRRLNLGGNATPASFDRDQPNPWRSSLDGVVLTGKTCLGYHTNVDWSALERSLRAAGWVIFWTANVSSCNRIELWRAGR